MQHAPAKLGYSVKEAVAATSLSRSHVYRMIAGQIIETRRVGNRIVIPAASLHKLIEG